MCGRFAASTQPQDIVELFGVHQWDPVETIAPSWNVPPTAPVHAVLERIPSGGSAPVRQLRVLRWGLVPAWAKSPESAAKMINARADTVHEKPSYRQAFASRRCLLPVDGYYEWQTAPSETRPRRQPYFVSRVDGAPLALAGIYEFWRDRSRPADHPEAWLVTCAVLTTEAEELLAPIHERMPLYLEPSAFDSWLDPALSDADEARSLLVAPDPGLLKVVPVSAAVGSIRNNRPGLTEPVTPEEEGLLF
ncbi:putative SOS response-associated peptidase YedK [Kitasatospora sp. MAP12-15]|uniref:SOS response-associated peptidase n=1 Tax=unclassified Kitasatospora TaxID=2633591 RepID=UPI002475A511|nr:SOS response-associated peptidase [Kitasatospora sp. MAP12-44]MDH6112720.1 putative SOS response-associated peptidase YedK [Kitasatospora sp. MAP12-44]